MNRGEVWLVETVGRTRTVVVVGNDAVTALHHIVQCVEIVPPGTAPDTLVTVPVETPVAGLAHVANVGGYLKKRFTERLGVLDADTMGRIDTALRAVFDL